MPRKFLPRVLSRAWEAVKPPPPLPARHHLNRAQRRLLRVTAIVLALGASTWAVFAYIESAPERANRHYREGVRLLGPGDFQGAAAEFTKAIAIVPQSAGAYLGRGKARQAAGQTVAALADFEKAISIDPTLDLAYTARGAVELSQGDVQSALADFTRSIHLHPTADAYYQRGLTYQTLGEAKLAVDNYDLAIVYDPGAPHIYRARASVKHDLGDKDGSDADQKTARDLEQKQ